MLYKLSTWDWKCTGAGVDLDCVHMLFHMEFFIFILERKRVWRRIERKRKRGRKGTMGFAHPKSLKDFVRLQGDLVPPVQVSLRQNLSQGNANQ